MQIEQEREDICAFARYGLRPNAIALVFGVTEEFLLSGFGEDIAAVARKAKQTVLSALYEMAISKKSISATLFWVKTFCADLLPTPPAKDPSRKSSKSTAPREEFVPRPFKFEVYNNDGEPNADY